MKGGTKNLEVPIPGGFQPRLHRTFATNPLLWSQSTPKAVLAICAHPESPYELQTGNTCTKLCKLDRQKIAPLVALAVRIFLPLAAVRLRLLSPPSKHGREHGSVEGGEMTPPSNITAVFGVRLDGE